jgi:hypothetical protein
MDEQSSADLDADAADLAWAILRFEQSVLPAAIESAPTLGGARLGEAGVTLFPLGKVVPIAGVATALRELPKPVVLGSLSSRGHVGVWSSADMGTAERHRMEHEFANQLDGLRMCCSDLSLTSDSRILLDTGLEKRVISVNTVTRCLRDYAVLVGWRVKQLQGDPRADAQLVLITGGGHMSPGWRDGSSP